MSERLITALGMAIKYDENVPTFSIIGVKPVAYKKTSKGSQKRVFRERDLANGLIKLYLERRDRYIKKAEYGQNRAREVKRIYEGGKAAEG